MERNNGSPPGGRRVLAMEPLGSYILGPAVSAGAGWAPGRAGGMEVAEHYLRRGWLETVLVAHGEDNRPCSMLWRRLPPEDVNSP